MLGNPKEPKFKAKGGETRCLVPFFLGLIESVKDKLPDELGDAMLEALRTISEMIQIMTQENRWMSERGAKKFNRIYVKHLKAGFQYLAFFN